MKPTRRLNRRSFMARVAGGLAASGGALLLLLAPKATAQPVTDSDPTDPVGGGRGGTGVTDRDPTDPAGRGRGGGSGVTDSDLGANADPVGRGRGSGGRAAYQDSDNSDPVGYARRPPRDDYVDCTRTRERLAEVERIIALVEDEGRFADMQDALARARGLEEQARRDLFADRDIMILIEAQGVSCTFASGTQCISRLESLVGDVARARQNSQALYTERARLWADLQRACGGVNR